MTLPPASTRCRDPITRPHAQHSWHPIHSSIHWPRPTPERPASQQQQQREKESWQANRKRVNAITPLLPMFRQTDISLSLSPRVHDATALLCLPSMYAWPACHSVPKPKSLIQVITSLWKSQSMYTDVAIPSIILQYHSNIFCSTLQQKLLQIIFKTHFKITLAKLKYLKIHY